MLQLWRAEWLKVRRRPANLGLLITTLGIVVISMVIMILIAAYQSEDSEIFQEVSQVLPYPLGFSIPMDILSDITTFLAIIFVANSVGSEYSRDTWKMILIRRAERFSFLVIKLLSTFVFMAIVIMLTLVIGQLVALVGAAVLGLDLIHSGRLEELTPYVKAVVPMAMHIIFFASLTLIAAILTRSSIGGIVVGIIAMVTLGLFSSFSTTLALISPATHLSNLEAHWIYNEEFIIQRLAETMGQAVSPWISLFVVLGYTAVLIGIGLYTFSRRDIAGS